MRESYHLIREKRGLYVKANGTCRVVAFVTANGVVTELRSFMTCAYTYIYNNIYIYIDMIARPCMCSCAAGAADSFVYEYLHELGVYVYVIFILIRRARMENKKKALARGEMDAFCLS